MTLVNRLIKEARNKPDHLAITPSQVRKIAAHAHSLMMTTARPSIEQIEGYITAGTFKLLGVPVQVEAWFPTKRDNPTKLQRHVWDESGWRETPYVRFENVE